MTIPPPSTRRLADEPDWQEEAPPPAAEAPPVQPGDQAQPEPLMAPPPDAGEFREPDGEADALEQPRSDAPPAVEPLTTAPPVSSRERSFLPSEQRSAAASRRREAEEWYNRLRSIRAEVQDLREVLHSIRHGEASLQRYADYIKLSCRQINKLISSLEGDDTIRRIRNTWEKMRTCPLLRDPDSISDAQVQLQHLIVLDAQCRELIYWTAYNTVPRRLAQWLEVTQPGYAIPFHAVFEDEVPDAEDRQRILNYLAWSPNVIPGGIIDPDSGLVLRYSESPERRRRSLGAAGGSLVVATLLVWLLGLMPPLAAINVSSLLVGWAALLIGTLTHVGVGVAKRMRVQGPSPAVLPTGRFLLLVDARLGEIIFKVIMAVVGYMAFVYAAGLPAGDDLGAFLLNAFLIGYSLDSVVELFGAAIDQRSAAFRSNLTSKLETKPEQ